MARDRDAIVRDLIDAGRRLDDLGFVPARDGNLSARLDEGRILITVTGVPKRSLSAEHLVEVNLDGQPLTSGKPSGELGIHLGLYRAHHAIESVVHAHPPVAGGFACAGKDLTMPMMPEAVVHLGPVPLVPYATPGSPELEKAVTEASPGYHALLLANHGAVSMGGSVAQALDRMETLEHLARMTLIADLAGGAKSIDAKHVQVLKAFIGSS